VIRQDDRPIAYDVTRRMDNVSALTSGPAGVVIPVTYAPLLRGDAATGRILLDMELAEMPRPLENAVLARAQAWFVPRPALPQFSGLDEFTHSYHGKNISVLGASDRTPAALYATVGSGAIAAAQSSEFFKALGISLIASTAINTDLIDSYIHVYNFRKGAHSSKMANEDYYSENATTALQLKPAFWPRNRMHQIVPDYEQALVKGSLDLDISAGELPLKGLGVSTAFTGSVDTTSNAMDGAAGTFTAKHYIPESTHIRVGDKDGNPYSYADMANQTVATSLADIDKARTTQAFAKRVAAYAGHDFSGFNNDDVVMSEFMLGFDVPMELQQRPWLLSSKTTVFGMTERHATDAANLDDSSSTGRAQIALSINIPRAEYGGTMIATVEVMPERLYERQQHPDLYVTTVDDLPSAMRDLQRTEAVDSVLNSRIDTSHSTPSGQYGYEPMNAKWQREFTRLGGEFRQLTPGTPNTAARTAIWQADYVDPAFTSDHWLCAHPFPQDVFAVPANDIVNIHVKQQLTITGITQFGDPLVEDNSEFANVEAEQS
jgi:hypothetical protein